MRIADTMLQYYLRIADPDALSNEEWAAKYQELKYIRDKEAEANK